MPKLKLFVYHKTLLIHIYKTDHQQSLIFFFFSKEEKCMFELIYFNKLNLNNKTMFKYNYQSSFINTFNILIRHISLQKALYFMIGRY